jgi:uncharacterized protein YceK
MPGRGLGLAGVAAVALLGGGCGTLVNVTGFAPPEIGGGQRLVYGGVVWDLEGEHRALTTPYPQYRLGVRLPMIFFYLFDLPLSAVGDTLTLPITLGEAVGLSAPMWPSPPERVVVVGPPAAQLPPPRVVPPTSAYGAPVVPKPSDPTDH